MNIYSNIHEGLLLHVIVRADEVTESRNDIIPQREQLQLATMKLPKGKTFKAHRHLHKDGSAFVIAQESWVVMKGSVKCFLYDTNNTILATPTLGAGDCSITLYGGHNYEILEDDTVIYEFKTGPYEGVEKDKVFIDLPKLDLYDKTFIP